MTRNYHRIQETSGKRQSNVLPVFTVVQQQNGRRMSTFINSQRRLSLVSQLSLPHGAEYRPQKRLPPNGLESQPNILPMNLTTMIKDNTKPFHAKSTKKSKPSQHRLLSHLCCVADNGRQYGDDMHTFDV
ncbi:unnamed protein product [Rotaria sp. Silwood2]|nr:unnamed protein product [Rotaria sp. Silwood2]CAF2521150.1 unnamed protein product [Rotaria sp. Silwood2]CAF2778739.1 unnamed protein product [Rotaria sp. Silwood2]CAF2953228.1 unnamed protein product [Rotaria sp. Silwood2]CAF3958781.1 unnamed protein product [Rotaria sp. Silwood2]